MAQVRKDDPSASAVSARVARNLRWVREIMSPSAAQTARDLGIDNANRWTRYEDGSRKLDQALAIRFCELYGCTLDFLYRDKLDGMDEALKLRLVAEHPELAPEVKDRRSASRNRLLLEDR